MQTCTTLQASPPLLRAWIGTAYGWRTGSHGQPDYHTGIDFGAPAGSPVLAILPGVVVAAAPSGSRGFARYGNTVVVRHAPALFSLYAHLLSISPLVTVGARVAPAQLLGAVGDSAGTEADPWAHTSSPHLHFETPSRWPTHGPDTDRPDPAPLLTQIGVIIAPRAAMRFAPGSAAELASRCVRGGASSATSGTYPGAQMPGSPASTTAPRGSSSLLWLLAALIFGGGDLF